MCSQKTDWLNYMCGNDSAATNINKAEKKQTLSKFKGGKFCQHAGKLYTHTHTLSIGNTVITSSSVGGIMSSYKMISYPHLALHSHLEVRVLRWITSMSVCVCRCMHVFVCQIIFYFLDLVSSLSLFSIPLVCHLSCWVTCHSVAVFLFLSLFLCRWHYPYIRNQTGLIFSFENQFWPSITSFEKIL